MFWQKYKSEKRENFMMVRDDGDDVIMETVFLFRTKDRRPKLISAIQHAVIYNITRIFTCKTF